MVGVVKQTNPGWLKRLLKRYDNQAVLAIGYPASKTAGIRYPDGTPVTLVAAVNNFGSPSRGIPQREFMHRSAPAAIKATAPIQKALMPALNAGKVTPEQILGHMGDPAVAAFKTTIDGITDPPNAQSTIDAKGSSKPLQDTGLMRNSLTYVVRPGGKK